MSESPKPLIWITHSDGTREYVEVTSVGRGEGLYVGWDGVPRDFWTREPLPLDDDDGVET